MTNLPQEVCLKFKEARVAKGLNQSSLARLVGCRQSAISMFEGGMATKLSDVTVKKISEVLGVPLQSESKHDSDENQARPIRVDSIYGYCPNSECPSNVPYVAGGHLFYWPSRAFASPTGRDIRCACCGEFLELKCPACGAPLNDGACCTNCGSPYVTVVLSDDVDAMAYSQMRREEISQLRKLAER